MWHWWDVEVWHWWDVEGVALVGCRGCGIGGV